MSDIIKQTSETMARKVRVMLGRRNNYEKSLHELITGLVETLDSTEQQLEKRDEIICSLRAKIDVLDRRLRISKSIPEKENDN